MIKVVDRKCTGKSKARTFAADVSRPEYYSSFVVDGVPATEQNTFRKELRKLTFS